MATTLPTAETFTKGADAAAKYLARPLNLYEIRLPAGDVGSINIAFFRNGASMQLDPQAWLSQGYDGVRLIGAGVDRTVIRCNAWDGRTIAVGRHPGVVQLEGVTLYAGNTSATQIGEQNFTGQTVPAFGFRFYESKAIVPEPGSLGRSKWLLFGYQSDVHLRDVELDAYHALEHASYWHGHAKRGLLWERVTMRASGAEGCKIRSDATETAWAGPNAWTIVRGSSFRNWHQPWSSRGGAAIVLQGAATHVLIEGSTFWGGGAAGHIESQMRSKAIMISSEADSFDQATGARGTGFGNGFVSIRRCALRGYSDYDWHNTIIRCAPNSGTQKAARGLLIDQCGVWGKNMIVQTGGMPERTTLIQRCNSPAVRSYCDAIGMDTTHEATFPTAARRVLLSEGIVR
jgi:hypothetical protein